MQTSWDSRKHLLSAYRRPACARTSLLAGHKLRQLLRRWLHQLCGLCAGGPLRTGAPFSRLLLLLVLGCVGRVEPKPVAGAGDGTAARWDFACQPDAGGDALSGVGEQALYRKIVQESERANAHSNGAINTFVSAPEDRPPPP